MATTDASPFGTLLRQLRLRAELTQEALAERSSVSVKAIRGLERNPNRLPRLDTVTLLADALELDPTMRSRFIAAARPDIVTDATPPVLLSHRPHFPRPITPLIGRQRVVDEIAELVRHSGHQIVTLTGPGGVGKTRLAFAVAETLADEFAEGPAFVDLAPLRDPDLVVPAIARCLGMDERGTAPLISRLEALLHEKRFVLILDNFEHLTAARDAALRLVESCPSLILLVTSRAVLRVRGEFEYRVAPLEVSDPDDSPTTLQRSSAVQLFLDRARSAGVNLEPDVASTAIVAAICRRLDGLPLAIELAAAWLRLLPLPALLARLEHRLPMLAGGPHDLPARQQTMRDAITWSYELLNAPGQRTFRQLSVFVDGFTVEAAEAVCDDSAQTDAVSTTTTLTQLAGLADRSLLQRDDARHATYEHARLTLLETIREYAAEQLEKHGDGETARARHATHFLMLAETADQAMTGPDGLVVRARLARENANLRTALEWLLQRGEGADALRLAGALSGFWSERGHLSEGRQWLRRALAITASRAEQLAAIRGKALVGAAVLAIEQAAYDEASDLCEEAIELAQTPARRPDLVAALNTRGLLLRSRGRYRDAASDYETAHTLAEAAGDRLGEAVALAGLATTLGFMGDTRSVRLAERSMEAFRELGDARGLAESLLSIMWRATTTGDLQRVEALGDETLGLFRALGDDGRLAETLFVLGLTEQFQGQFEPATAFHEEGLRIRRGRGDERGTVEQLAALAAIALQRGDLSRARGLLGETLSILERYDDPWNRALSLVLLAQVELAEGDVERAAIVLAESAAIYHAIDNLLYVPWCLEGLAGVAAAQGAWHQAARLCGARDALRRRLDSPMPPCYPEGFAQAMVGIQSALSADELATARAEGEALPIEAVLDEAAWR